MIQLHKHQKWHNWFDHCFVVILQWNVCMYVAALMALKRKKRYEKQLQQIDGTLSTIEFQREALQNASTNTEVLRVMGDAAKALKSAHKNMYDQLFFLLNRPSRILTSLW